MEVSMKTLLLDIITCGWLQDDVPAVVHDEVLEANQHDPVKTAKRLKQLYRCGQPDEICAITYRMIDMSKDDTDMVEPSMILVRTKHAELSDLTIEKIDVSRSYYNQNAVSLQEASSILKEAFASIDQNPVFSSWGHYPIDRLKREFTRSRSKSVFGSRVINIKLVMSFLTVDSGKELSLREAIGIVWKDLGKDNDRGRTAFDDLDAMSDIAWWCLHKQKWIDQ